MEGKAVAKAAGKLIEVKEDTKCDTCKHRGTDGLYCSPCINGCRPSKGEFNNYEAAGGET